MATILVIDDEQDVRTILKIFLEKEKHTVLLAKNAKEAADHINTGKPEIIILDILMPDINGFKLAKIIKEEIGDTVKILFLTSLNSTNDLVKSFDVGGSEFMSKPINFDELREKIKKLLSQSNGKRITTYKLQ